MNYEYTLEKLNNLLQMNELMLEHPKASELRIKSQIEELKSAIQLLKELE